MHACVHCGIYIRVGMVYFGQLRKDSVISPTNEELRLRVFHPDTDPHVTYLSSPYAQPHPPSCTRRAHALCSRFRRWRADGYRTRLRCTLLHGRQYSKVCGEATTYQIGSTDVFGYRAIGQHLNENYVYGVSLWPTICLTTISKRLLLVCQKGMIVLI